MINSINIIKLWGILDILSISWFIGWKFTHGELPFYSDIVQSIETGNLFEMPYLVTTVAVFSILFYISLIFTGICLVRLKKIGAILTYIQIPARLFTLIPPSIFFIVWPLKYIFENPKTITVLIIGVGLILLSESLKLTSVIIWHKNLKTA